MKRMGKQRTLAVAAWTAAVMTLAIMAPGAVRAGVAPERAAANLAAGTRFETVSFQDEAQVDAGAFLAYHDFLEQTYPLVHANLVREKVGQLGLLYTWEGTDPSLHPIILLAHMDVVPIAPGTLPDWTYPPFEGRVADGYIWGRGTMDCKGFLMAELEAVEGLLAEGYRPRRTVYLCFGQDEEVGGWKGAAQIAELLKSRGVFADLVVDEGGMIVDGKIMGIDQPLAMIGIAEKGYMSLELTVQAPGGHSSMPPPESAIGILAGALSRLEQHPFPARLGGVSDLTFEALAPKLPAAMRTAIKNKWLLGGVIKKELTKNPVTAAMVRTTTAVTIIEAGTKENVLPQEARAVVNFRLLPGDRVDDVIARVKEIIADPRVSVAPLGRPLEASKISNLDSDGYRALQRAIAELFPEVLPAPYLVLGGTDLRHYEDISDSLYRFAPMRVGPDDQERLHGTNERISVDNYLEIINFYTSLVRNSGLE